MRAMLGDAIYMIPIPCQQLTVWQRFSATAISCQLPEGTDGTGYWAITIRALGYADTVVKFQTTAENLAKHELASDADRAALQAVVAEAQSKAKAAYTADSYANLETELAESVELLSRETLYKAAALEQVTHLTDAVQNLKAA